MKYWNLVWQEHLDQKGIKAHSLFNIVGKNQLFSTGPKRDGYNVLFFTSHFDEYHSQNTPSETQAVTIVRRNKENIKDTDIIVNTGNFKFFYDDNYNEDVYVASQKRSSKRNLSSSRDLTFMESIKAKLLSFFKGFLKLLKREVSPTRGIAAREVSVPRGLVDFPSLMIHELGHVPGLFHSDHESIQSLRGDSKRFASSSGARRSSVSSVMKAKLSSGSSRRTVGQFDLENLSCGYYRDL